MSKQLQEKSGWGLSYGECVWRRFTESPLNVSCLIFVAFLLLLAVFAPFLASDRPFIIFTRHTSGGQVDGRWRFPLLVNLQPVDYCILLAAVVGFCQLFLIRRNHRCVEPFVRGSRLARQVAVSCAIILLGSVLILATSGRHRLDATDYKALIVSGEATDAIFALVPYGYEHTDLKLCRQPPSHRHWLGTDDVGADVLCRLIHGSRISLSVGFVAVGIATIIGIVVGAILGYFGGKVDFIGMRVVEAVMAIPVFFLIITIVAFFPRSIFNIMIIIGVTSWTGSARFIRAEFLKLRQQDFVQAAVSLGLPLRSILFRHMLPNGIAPVLVNATFGISSAIFIEAALSFLGFGVAPPTPSWGQMLSLGVSTSGRFLWWLTLFPGLAIFLTVMAYNLAGEGLRDAIDPRLTRHTSGGLTPALAPGAAPAPRGRANPRRPASESAMNEGSRRAGSQNSALLSVEGLCVSFFTEEGVVPAVQDISFSIRKGETFALVGESGCGKTTAALAIMRLLPEGCGKVVQGKILFEGRNLLELSGKQMRLIRGNRISMVFQEPAASLNPVYTVGDQIAEAIELHQNEKNPATSGRANRLTPPSPWRGLRKAWEDVVGLLRRVGIADPRRTALEYPHRLSGGMQQRAMIAMAVSCNPAFLIADEPTTALDATTQVQILDLLNELQKQNSMSILLITHNLGVAAERADTIAVMYASRIVEIARLENPATSGRANRLTPPSPWRGLISTGTGSIGAGLHPYTQGLLRSLPQMGSAVKRLQTIPGTVPQPLHFPSGCKFHPRCRIGCSDNRCQEIEPALREIQPGRWVACWHVPGYE